MSEKVSIWDWLSDVLEKSSNGKEIIEDIYTPIKWACFYIVKSYLTINDDLKSRVVFNSVYNGFEDKGDLKIIKSAIIKSEHKAKILLTLNYLVNVLGGIKDDYTDDDINNMIIFFFKKIFRVSGINNIKFKMFLFNNKIVVDTGMGLNILKNSLRYINYVIYKIFVEDEDCLPLYQKDNYEFIKHYLKEFDFIYQNKH